MVNFDVIGVVNFRKGCYLGQEVVVCSQYCGMIKCCIVFVYVVGEIDIVYVGVELFYSDDLGQLCGMIVNVVVVLVGGVNVLVEIKFVVFDSGMVYFGLVDGLVFVFDVLLYVWLIEV